MAEWSAWTICLQVFVFVVITIVLLVQASSKRRAPRLKNSKQLEATLLINDTSILPVKIYLPSRQFIANMMASLDRHTREARLFWEHEKAEFTEIFNRLSDELKLHLMETLSTELSDSLQCYNPNGDLAAILCPVLKQPKNLLECSTNPSNSSASEGNAGHDDGDQHTEVQKDGRKILNVASLFEFLMEDDMRKALESRPTISVARVKIVDLGEGPDGTMIKPPLPSSIGKDSKDGNSNDKTKETISDNVDDSNNGEDGDAEDIKIESMSPDELDFRDDTENLLKGLKILSYLLFMKQFLSRYHSHEKPPSKLWLALKATGRSGLFALTTGGILYFIVEYNIIGRIWPEFDNSEGKNSWRPTLVGEEL